MSTIADDDRRVIAGVDTHKDFHVVVVLDEHGRRLDQATFPTTTRGYRDLTRWVNTPGRTYYLRKQAEGQTKKEALRALRRRISDAVYRQLITDTTG